MRITAEPKTDNLPYSAVEFVVAPDQHIKVVKVTGFDRSITGVPLRSGEGGSRVGR